MGIYLNPDNKGFRQAIRSEIYVDKTGMIKYTNKCLNTEQKYICVSRPRRFGKSMALKMLAAYYSRGCDSAELFQGYAIKRDKTFLEHLNQYDVIFLNMQQFLIRAKNQEVTEYLERVVIAEIRKAYGELFPEEETILAAVLEQIYAETGKEFVFLIDEWDCVMRERQESEELQKQYLDFLRNLLKDQSYVALAYMTGILPVKKYGVHSALNMFSEYSMTDQYALEEYTGFTEREVKELCARFNMDFVETGSWYDGYMLTEFRHVYNPKSVVEAMRRHKFSNYWTSTETYDALKPYMEMNFDGLRSDVMRVLKASERLLEDTLNGDGQRVAEALDKAHTEVASILTYNDENSLSCAIGLAYYSARKDYRLIREFPTGRGFADVVFLPLPHTDKPALVVELKYDKTVETAMKQIKDRHYTQALERYCGEILLVGINYNKENANKPHTCAIEKVNWR